MTKFLEKGFYIKNIFKYTHETVINIFITSYCFNRQYKQFPVKSNK